MVEIVYVGSGINGAYLVQFCSRQIFLDLGILFKAQKLHMEDLPCSPEILFVMWVYQILTDVKCEQPLLESTWFIKAVESPDPSYDPDLGPATVFTTDWSSPLIISWPD